jgi:hypothetical protein
MRSHPLNPPEGWNDHFRFTARLTFPRFLRHESREAIVIGRRELHHHVCTFLKIPFIGFKHSQDAHLIEGCCEPVKAQTGEPRIAKEAYGEVRAQPPGD